MGLFLFPGKILSKLGVYNNRRPHQALGMKTPAEAFALQA
jgi:transposase InsO family protein